MTELVESLKWPATALVAFTIGSIIFRKPFAALLTRVRSIRRDGIETSDPVSQLESKEESSPDALLKTFDTPLVLEQENLIRAELKKRGLDTSAQTAEILIRHLAHAQMAAAFERLYRTIYGSQIRILRESNCGGGVSIDHTKAYFQTVCAENQEFYASYPFAEYIAFLLNFGLILERNGFYHSTVRGQAFLEWMVRNQLSEKKAF